MKYVIIKGGIEEMQRAFPFIFPDRLTHSLVAEHARKAVECEFGPRAVAAIYSAGECSNDDGHWDIEHGSNSLWIKRDEAQAAIDYKVLNWPEALQSLIELDKDKPQ